MLGYLRDMLIAWVFGTGLYSDAFITAFRIPEFLRRLLADGAFGMGFIPIYNACLRREGPVGAERLAASTVQVLALLLVPIIIVGLIGTPWIVRLIAPGYTPGNPVFDMTVELTRIMWPYLFFAGLVAVLAGVLNAHGHFAAPVLAPVALNLVLITTLLAGIALALPTVARVRGLAMGVVAAGLVQLLIQFSASQARRLPLWSPVVPLHGELGAVARMTVPTAIGAAAFQFNTVIGTLLASFLAPGSIAALFFADRLIQFPLGLFAVSAATALMPGLSRQAADADWQHFNANFQETLRLVWFITLPAITGLVVLRVPIVQILLERGAFSSNSTRLTSEALLCYATGLWAYGGLRIVQTAFYALKDARTPLIAAGAGMAINLVVGAGLMNTLGLKGIALGGACAAVTHLGILLIVLRRRIGTLGGKATGLGFIKAAGCSAAMGFMVAGLRQSMRFDYQSDLAAAGLQLLACVGAGAAGYLVLAWLCRSSELRALFRIARQKGWGR